MPKLTINNRQVQVTEETTILAAAEKLGIEIPTMCFVKGLESSSSCMVCVVQVDGGDQLLPACATLAQEGMEVVTDSDYVKQARRTALELLLSDHLGDCMGPCQVICPAGMNIPQMIRQIQEGEFRDAIITIKKDIALPAVLGRICPAPCEKGCRRGKYDEPISICVLKRFVADYDLASAKPYIPVCEQRGGQKKSVALIGSGPAGLSSAYYLLTKGYSCTIYDNHDKPGGMLRYGVPEEELPRDVLDAEIDIIRKVGAVIKCGIRIGEDISLDKLRRDYDAVFFAAGRIDPERAKAFGFETTDKGISFGANTYRTNLESVFAGGDAVRKRRLAVRACGDGKEAAISIDQFLSGAEVAGPGRVFNSQIGSIDSDEAKAFMKGISDQPRNIMSKTGPGFTDSQAISEAKRCMHCDCRKPVSCKLRKYSCEYEVNKNRYKGQRRQFVQSTQHPEVIYEPGKCIDCGLCIQIASKSSEKLGLSFVGRGFDVKVAVPFGRNLAEGLQKVAQKSVENCPTGALSFKKDVKIY